MSCMRCRWTGGRSSASRGTRCKRISSERSRTWRRCGAHAGELINRFSEYLKDSEQKFWFSIQKEFLWESFRVKIEWNCWRICPSQNCFLRNNLGKAIGIDTQVDEALKQGDGGAYPRLREEGGGAAVRHDQPEERHRLPQGPGAQFNWKTIIACKMSWDSFSILFHVKTTPFSHVSQCT